LAEINLVGVHDLGFTGSNVLIGVMDGGFNRIHTAFHDPAHPLNVIAEWDFVDNEHDTGQGPGQPLFHGAHGDWVLGVLAAYVPNVLVGGAYDASFILCRTEDVAAEYPGEEDNYVAGLEFIEAQGGDMVSTSIGYEDWYDQEDLDGLTTVCAIGANIATGNGVHLCVVAGNNGHDDDPATSSLLTPTDAFDVISVGAVWSDGSTADFSSDGPTADGRVKPEVMARGENTRSIDVSGDVEYMGIGGTSFSTPLVAGAVACLIDAYPDWSVQKMREALFATADYYVANGTFDPLYVRGYGIIDTLAALRADCNDNDIDDLTDISGGGSADCNGNDIPDECEEDCDGNDIPEACESFSDCNANGRPDVCDPDCNGDGAPDDCETDGAEQDCDRNGICNGPEIANCPPGLLLCADCNLNGVPDLCDIRSGSSPDGNGNWTPDECDMLPALVPSAPHHARKNRYISFDPGNPGTIVAFQVEMTDSLEFPGSTGISGWVGEPEELASGEYVSRMVDTPALRYWTEPVIHLGDCEIVPAATYRLRSTVDEVLFSDPLELGTIEKPGAKYYGDVVGTGTGALPPEPGFTEPNGAVNVSDVQAFLLTVQGPTSPSVHTTWVDLHGLGDGVPPNFILNVSDLQRILWGIDGQQYLDAPEHLDPAHCP
jgi:hypothetical protein